MKKNFKDKILKEKIFLIFFVKFSWKVFLEKIKKTLRNFFFSFARGNIRKVWKSDSIPAQNMLLLNKLSSIYLWFFFNHIFLKVSSKNLNVYVNVSSLKINSGNQRNTEKKNLKIDYMYVANFRITYEYRSYWIFLKASYLKRFNPFYM